MRARKLNAAMAAGRERVDALEPRLARQYESVLGRAGVRAAERFTAKVTDPDAVSAAARWTPPQLEDVLDRAALAESARAKTKATHRAMLKTQVGSVLADAGISWTVRHPLSQELLNALAARADDIADGLREPIANVIADSLAAGRSVPETASAIRHAVDGVKGWQATMLARNDLIGVSNGGSLLTARILLANDPASASMKQWLSAGDALVRPSHAAASGQTVKLDQPFSVGSSYLQHPGDPAGAHADVVNCRCTHLFVDAPKSAKAPARESITKGQTSQEILGDAVDTQQLYTDASGTYSEARRPLHQQIIAAHLKGAARPTKPRSVFLAGGSGAGKSTVRAQMRGLPKNAVMIDPDAIKDMLPEYRTMVKAGDPYAAVAAHEEASAISKQVLTEANELRTHVVIDGTGNSGPGKFAAKIKQQQELGQDVEVVLVDTPLDVALDRVNARASRTGRYIPEDVVADIHAKVSASFTEWRELTDWQVWANDDVPRLIARRRNGVEKIYDEARFEQMIDKARQ